MWLLSSSFLLLLLVLKSLVPQASDDDGNDEENSPSVFPMMNKPPESSTSNAKFSEHATLTIFGFLEAPPINVSMRVGNISASRFSEGDALFSASSLFLL